MDRGLGTRARERGYAIVKEQRVRLPEETGTVEGLAATRRGGLYHETGQFTAKSEGISGVAAGAGRARSWGGASFVVFVTCYWVLVVCRGSVWAGELCLVMPLEDGIIPNATGLSSISHNSAPQLILWN